MTVSVRKVFIDLLRIRLSRLIRNFDESGSRYRYGCHADVTRARPRKIADQECAQKNAPVSRGVFAFSQYRPKA